MTTWHDLESAREEWEDAPLSDGVLQALLDISEQQVIAYAPALPVPTDPEAPAEIPANYRYYQLMQATNIWNAGRVDASGGVGEGEFVARPHPLDWQIKQGLRPRRAVPRVR